MSSVHQMKEEKGYTLRGNSYALLQVTTSLAIAETEKKIERNLSCAFVK